jgi:hypothetical protein
VKLERFLGHGLTQLGVAAVLIVAAVIEAAETVFDDFANLRLRVAHGLLLVAVWQILRAIPDLVEGMERYLESRGRHEGESPKVAAGGDVRPTAVPTSPPVEPVRPPTTPAT